jgi:hypothetical protein
MPEDLDSDVAVLQPSVASPVPVIPTQSVSPPAPVPAPDAECPTCGASMPATPPSYVYALGVIEPRFPRISVEKEFIQATGRAETANLTDRQALQRVLSEPQNRYLARQLCWIMTVGGLETYLLYPRDPSDLSQLIGALRPNPQPGDLDLIIGTCGSFASPDVCNGLTVPVVTFDQVYSFDRGQLIGAIPRPKGQPEARFNAAAAELFDRIVLIADNAGTSDEHRALNYLTVRYPHMYAAVAEAFARSASLSGIDVKPAPLGGLRNVVEVIFSFTDRTTGVMDKQFVRVDVTEQFPFLVTKLSPYFDR